MIVEISSQKIVMNFVMGITVSVPLMVCNEFPIDVEPVRAGLKPAPIKWITARVPRTV